MLSVFVLLRLLSFEPMLLFPAMFAISVSSALCNHLFRVIRLLLYLHRVILSRRIRLLVADSDFLCSCPNR